VLSEVTIQGVEEMSVTIHFCHGPAGERSTEQPFPRTDFPHGRESTATVAPELARSFARDAGTTLQMIDFK
jgi:hypothetical protein